MLSCQVKQEISLSSWRGRDSHVQWHTDQVYSTCKRLSMRKSDVVHQCIVCPVATSETHFVTREIDGKLGWENRLSSVQKPHLQTHHLHNKHKQYKCTFLVLKRAPPHTVSWEQKERNWKTAKSGRQTTVAILIVTTYCRLRACITHM